MIETPDPLPLAQALIRKPSVTPASAGALEELEAELTRLGFACRRFPFGGVDNLYARRGNTGRNFCFAGHLDVVPPGDEAAWTSPPFGGEIEGPWLCGRGASDMKAAIAAMVAACDGYLKHEASFAESLSFLITMDEEGPAIDGTKKVLAALKAEGEAIDHCLVGEPTSVDAVGDTIKNGRRGSLNALVTVRGKQGHVAYPRLAANPVSAILDFLQQLRSQMLDGGAPGFEASNLEVTTIDVDNPSSNVIPAEARARFNIRFNTRHTGETLLAFIEEYRARMARLHAKTTIEVNASVSGEPFVTQPGSYTDLVQGAVEAVLGRRPKLSTSGGTSDARFIKDYCPVLELGLQNATAHKVDERVRVDDVRALARCYAEILSRYFAYSTPTR